MEFYSIIARMINDFEALLSHPVVGMSWESYVIENIITMLPDSATTHFYRTAAGAEIDLLIEFSATKRWAIEIKRGLAPQLSKRFYSAIEDIKPQASFIVYSGNDNYTLAPNIEITSLSTLMNLINHC